MGIQSLLDQAEEERQCCRLFQRNPWQSKRYRSIQRQILIRHENTIPVVRITKRVAVAVLIVAIPTVLIVWAWIITTTISLIIS